jgi:hypothetical protein
MPGTNVMGAHPSFLNVFGRVASTSPYKLARFPSKVILNRGSWLKVGKPNCLEREDSQFLPMLLHWTKTAPPAPIYMN